MNAIENSNHVDYDENPFHKNILNRTNLHMEMSMWIGLRDNIHRDGYEQRIFGVDMTVEKREVHDAYNAFRYDIDFDRGTCKIIICEVEGWGCT